MNNLLSIPQRPPIDLTQVMAGTFQGQGYLASHILMVYKAVEAKGWIDNEGNTRPWIDGRTARHQKGNQQQKTSFLQLLARQFGRSRSFVYNLVHRLNAESIARMDRRQQRDRTKSEAQFQARKDRLEEIARKIKRTTKRFAGNLDTIIHGQCEEIVPTLPFAYQTCLCDPPYGVGVQERVNKLEVEWEWADNAEDYEKKWLPIYKTLYHHLAPGGTMIVWGSGKYAHHWWRWYGEDLEAAGYDRLPLFVHQIPPCDPWSAQAECLDLALLWTKGKWTKGKTPRLWPQNMTRGNGFASSMTERPGATDLARCHRCPKTLSVCRYLISHFTLPGSIVLVPFAGSGQECLAARAEGRRFLGIEADEKNAKLCMERLGLVS